MIDAIFVYLCIGALVYCAIRIIFGENYERYLVTPFADKYGHIFNPALMPVVVCIGIIGSWPYGIYLFLFTKRDPR